MLFIAKKHSKLGYFQFDVCKIVRKIAKKLKYQKSTPTISFVFVRSTFMQIFIGICQKMEE